MDTERAIDDIKDENKQLYSALGNNSNVDGYLTSGEYYTVASNSPNESLIESMEFDFNIGANLAVRENINLNESKFLSSDILERNIQNERIEEELEKEVKMNNSTFDKGEGKSINNSNEGSYSKLVYKVQGSNSFTTFSTALESNIKNTSNININLGIKSQTEKQCRSVFESIPVTSCVHAKSSEKAEIPTQDKYIYESEPCSKFKADAKSGEELQYPVQTQTIFEVLPRSESNADAKSGEQVKGPIQTQSVFEVLPRTVSNADAKAYEKVNDPIQTQTQFEAFPRSESNADAKFGELNTQPIQSKIVYESIPYNSCVDAKYCSNLEEASIHMACSPERVSINKERDIRSSKSNLKPMREINENSSNLDIDVSLLNKSDFSTNNNPENCIFDDINTLQNDKLISTQVLDKCNLQQSRGHLGSEDENILSPSKYTCTNVKSPNEVITIFDLLSKDPSLYEDKSHFTSSLRNSNTMTIFETLDLGPSIAKTALGERPESSTKVENPEVKSTTQTILRNTNNNGQSLNENDTSKSGSSDLCNIRQDIKYNSINIVSNKSYRITNIPDTITGVELDIPIQSKTIFESTPNVESIVDARAGVELDIPIQSKTIFESTPNFDFIADARAGVELDIPIQSKTIFEYIPNVESIADARAGVELDIPIQSKTIFESTPNVESIADVRFCEKLPDVPHQKTVYVSLPRDSSITDVKSNDKTDTPNETQTIFVSLPRNKTTAHAGTNIKNSDELISQVKTIYEVSPRSASTADAKYNESYIPLVETRTIFESSPRNLSSADAKAGESTCIIQEASTFESIPIKSTADAKGDIY